MAQSNPQNTQPTCPFEDRAAAGRALARALKAYGVNSSSLILAMPKGGVRIGYEVAGDLGAELDMFVSIRLCAGHDRRTIGAITYDGSCRVDDQRVNGFGDTAELKALKRTEHEHAERLSFALRGVVGPPDVKGRSVVLVDDGFVTGNTARVALEKLVQLKPARLLAAAPVGTPEAVRLLGEVADAVYVLHTRNFKALEENYKSFLPVSDDELHQLLRANGSQPKAAVDR